MKIKNDIILIELRSFKRILNTYIGSIADSNLNNKLTNGACNRLRKLYKPNIESFTVEALQQFVKLYESNKPTTAYKTRSRSSTAKMTAKTTAKMTAKTRSRSATTKTRSRSATTKTRSRSATAKTVLG